MVVPIDVIGGIALTIAGLGMLFLGISGFPHTETDKRIKNILATAFTVGGFVFLLIKFDVTSVFGVDNVVPFIVGSYVTLILFQIVQLLLLDDTPEATSS